MTHRIERLGHQGDGIAPGPVFVPRTLPDEVVSGDQYGDRLENIRILTPSESRIASKCGAYKRCGGCSLHHASDDFIENWKQSIVLRALSAQGIEVDIRAIHTSPPNTRRRAKLSAHRTKKGAVVGMMGRASDMVHPIQGCLILSQNILNLIPALEAFTTEFGTRKARLGFWILDTPTGIDLAVDGIDLDKSNALSALAVWAGKYGLARLSVGDEVICKLTDPALAFGPVAVCPPPRAFTQATPEGEAALQRAVALAVGHHKKIVDLFAGCGTLGLPLAKQTTLHCVEGDADLIAALDQGVRHAQGIKVVTHERRDLFRMPLDHTDLARFGGAIVDPPRAGGEQQVAQLAKSTVNDIAMVSCNPITFARDAKLLIDGGYHLKWVEVVDQFRWSPHIEIASHFSKA